MSAHAFLVALTLVLGVAALTTILFHRLRLPIVLGYVLAGFVIGPHVPVPLVADREIVQTLSELGVILLMFSLGLEFSLGKLLRLGPRAGVTAVVQSSLMVWLGFVTGRLFGWTPVESLFAGAIIAISSTTIIAKAFDEQRVTGTLRELVVGVLIVEDLIAILLMALLTAVAKGAGLSARDVATTSGKLALFLVALVVLGLLLVPRATRALVRLGRPEMTLVASVAFCFAVALLAHAFGYSVALGAFIAGSLVAESGEEKTVAHLVEPVRDMFAAIFFVSVGLSIEPALVARHWAPIAALTGVVLMGKLLGVSLGAFLTGNGVRTSIRAGLSLAQIGEFSFIIAGLGLALGATRSFLYPVAVAVSAITTLTTPWLIRLSGPVASRIDRALPRPLQTFVTLYASWIERLFARPEEPTRSAAVRRLVKLLVVDVALLGAIVVAADAGMTALAAYAERALGLSPRVAHIAVTVVAVALATPLLAGLFRVSRRLGVTIAERALPAAESGRTDLAAAPRRSLVVTIQLAIVLMTGLPLLAVTQPVFGGVVAPSLFGIALLVAGLAFWRSATNLHGHVRAGAEAIASSIAAQAKKGTLDEAGESAHEDALQEVRALLPGLGEPVSVRITGDSPAVGKTLAELDFRGVTGATVLAITRGAQSVLVPRAEDVLCAGDVLAVAGSAAAIAAARSLLGSATPARNGVDRDPSLRDAAGSEAHGSRALERDDDA